jgi:hypothetical protein
MIQKTVFIMNYIKNFNHFPKHHMRILLDNVNAKLGKEHIFKPTIVNGSLHQQSNDKRDRIMNFAT